VLQAIMHPDPVPSACIRFGLGRFTTEDEIDYAVEKFAAVVGHLRRQQATGHRQQALD
jgi:cysteine desulfurase